MSHPELQNTNRIILGPNFSDTTQTVRDGQGHGTHVAGIVGAETNNSTGIGGTTWDSELLIVKTNDNSVFGVYTLSSFQNGVLYASDYADSTGKRVVINFSSGGGSGSQSYIDAINYAAARDVLIVAITHNDGASNGVRYPARYASSYSNVIAVGATDHNDSRASYSNAGPQITLTAPGGFGGSGAGDVRNIYSTMPNYAVALTQQAGYSQNYDYAPGTSMAAPHVSGAAALILSVNPDLTPAQVRSRLEDSADKVSGMSGQPFTNEYGYGRLNAYEAVKHALPVQLDGHFFAGNQTLNSTHIYNDIQGETSHEFGILTIPSDKVVVIDGTYTGFGSTWAKLYVNGRLVITEGTSMSQVALDIKNGGEVIIAKDANLSGVPVTIETGGAVEIRPGATLTNSEVIVENGGELLARGSSTDKITFNGKGIVFENGSGGEVSYAEIRNAATGIQLTGTGTNVQILDNLIENCTIGLKVYQSNALVAGNIIENNAYGINAEFVSSAAEYENNKVRYNSVRDLFLNASSMWITHSVFAGNGGNQVLINDGGPGFSESPGLEGYNVIAQGAGPMLRAQNGATVFMGYSIDGGYNSFYGTDLPHIYAQNHSGVYADRNYWDGGPGNHADGTSWVLDRYPLGSDPNPPYYQNILASRQSGASGSLPSISDTDTGSGPPVALIEALHLGMERNYEEALAELARFMEQQRHSEYAPLALFGYHALVHRMIGEAGSDTGRQSLQNSLTAFLQIWRDQGQTDPLWPFAVRLLARDALMTGNNEEGRDHYLSLTDHVSDEPSHVLLASYNLFGYYLEIERDADKALHYLDRLVEDYPEDDLTLTALATAQALLDTMKSPDAERDEAGQEITELVLHAAYPNPFNPAASIRYSLPEAGTVRLAVYDMLGRRVAELVNGPLEAGSHTADFDGSRLASGVYVYRLQSGGQVLTGKMMLVK
ncbi:MAG: S8 family serine peptidase [Cyclonatronaceae bacterium]